MTRPSARAPTPEQQRAGSRRLLACAVLGVLAACGGGSGHGDGGGGNALPAAYQGTWRSPCHTPAPPGESGLVQLVQGATTFTFATIIYTTATNCTGSSTVSQPESGTLSNAGTVTADLDGTPVTALMLDETPSGEPTDYTLLYVDTSVNPNRLYLGLGDAAHDGTSAAQRPVKLDPSRYYQKQ